MSLLNVDKTKCLKCGICVEACPACILTMGEEGPTCETEHGCMACGHCVCICPVGALDNKYTPLEKQRPITQPMLDGETAYEFLRMRRSVRAFKPAVPTDEDLTKLLEITRYAPTAGNTQGMYCLVIRDPEKIKAIAEVTADWMELCCEAGSEMKRYFTTILRVYRERKMDIIAREAPCLVFLLARRLNTTGVSNAEQSLAYAGLYAPTIGMGTCIAGFIQACGIHGYKPLLDLLEIPDKQKVVGCMMVGYPKYKYKRMPERQHLKVEFR
ncbi:MAG: nitroreductase family protein [Phascolarctobacterium sp.]|nr:nitroreductase family protein [Phascolarctobacterium sp.]